MMLHTNIKALGLVVSDKKIFSCFPDVKHATPAGRGHFGLHDHNLNKLCRGSLGDATYQISRL